MNEPLTSIVIPAYNAARYIERTLTSAMRQTYLNLEIIVIDDGSTDSTRKLADAAASVDGRIRVLTIPNSGVANARNVGTKEARGEYVAYLDADDLWHPTKIEAQVKAMLTPIDAVLPAASYTLMRSINDGDLVTGTGHSLALGGYALARHIYFKPVGNGSSVLVRRDVAIELGGYDPSWATRGIGGCEDLDFELKVVAKYAIAAVPLYLVGYRQYPGNMSSQRVRMARGAIGTIEKHIAANPLMPHWAVRLARVSVYEYASTILLDGRHWKLAAWATSRLTSLHIYRGIKFMYRNSRNRVKGKLGIGRDTWPAPLDHFYSLDPATMPIDAALSSTEQELFERLSALDMNLAREAKVQPSCA